MIGGNDNDINGGIFFCYFTLIFFIQRASMLNLSCG